MEAAATIYQPSHRAWKKVFYMHRYFVESILKKFVVKCNKKE